MRRRRSCPPLSTDMSPDHTCPNPATTSWCDSTRSGPRPPSRQNITLSRTWGGLSTLFAGAAERDAEELRDLWWRQRQRQRQGGGGRGGGGLDGGGDDGDEDGGTINVWDNLGDAAVTGSLVPENEAAFSLSTSEGFPSATNGASSETGCDEDANGEEEEEGRGSDDGDLGEEIYYPATPEEEPFEEDDRSDAAELSFLEKKKRRKDVWNEGVVDLPLTHSEDYGPQTKMAVGLARVWDNLHDARECDAEDQEKAEGCRNCQCGFPNDTLNPQGVLRLVHQIGDAKAHVVQTLSSGNGDTTDPSFLSALHRLLNLRRSSGFSSSAMTMNHEAAYSCSLDGTWLTLSRPNYHNCLGLNPSGEYMYTLGRMTFDMFRPTGLQCSVQGVFGQTWRVDGRDGRFDTGDGCVPRGLRHEVKDGETVLRTYK